MKTLETTNRLRRTDYMLDHCDGLRLNKQYLGPDEEIRSHLPLVTTKVASVDACFSRLRKLNVQDGSPDFGVRHVHPGCQPPSDEGCCRDARSPGPRLTQGEAKTTPKASVTPHQKNNDDHRNNNNNDNKKQGQQRHQQQQHQQQQPPPQQQQQNYADHDNHNNTNARSG